MGNQSLRVVPMDTMDEAHDDRETDSALSTSNLGRIFCSGGGVQGVSLNLRRGEILGVCGKSGCGKSTLLRLLAGILEPAAGSLTLFGDVRRAMVFQQPLLLPWMSAEDNIALVLQKKDPALVSAILAEMELSHAARLHPQQLSGGMQQRIAIARALVSRPNLLLLDEPLSSLDYFTSHELLSLLQRELDRHRVTTVYVSHDVRELARLCDRVLALQGSPGQPQVILNNPVHRMQRGKAIGRVAHFEQTILDALGFTG